MTRRVLREREAALAQEAGDIPHDAHLDHPAFAVDDAHHERSKVRARRGCLAILLAVVLLLAGAFFVVKNLGGSLLSGSSSSQATSDYTGNGTGSVQIVVRKETPARPSAKPCRRPGWSSPRARSRPLPERPRGSPRSSRVPTRCASR
ncbi:hypothetical protein [Branchiibius cervicis]|uniref:Uncharacterized protein n=1 Tax=Branchiibius cervicis TaxID=908252 RepID=A0ABW2ASA9_9MICO